MASPRYYYYGAILLNILHVILITIILTLYRNGDNGYFMGASYNRNHDSELYTIGIVFAYLIYSKAILLSVIFGDANSSGIKSMTNVLMNVLGFFYWLAAGTLILHFWVKFLPSNHFTATDPAKAGISMGALCIINGVLHMPGVGLAWINYRTLNDEDRRMGNTYAVQQERVPIKSQDSAIN